VDLRLKKQNSACSWLEELKFVAPVEVEEAGVRGADCVHFSFLLPSQVSREFWAAATTQKRKQQQPSFVLITQEKDASAQQQWRGRKSNRGNIPATFSTTLVLYSQGWDLRRRRKRGK